jgi:hypothetical protein
MSETITLDFIDTGGNAARTPEPTRPAFFITEDEPELFRYLKHIPTEELFRIIGNALDIAKNNSTADSNLRAIHDRYSISRRKILEYEEEIGRYIYQMVRIEAMLENIATTLERMDENQYIIGLIRNIQDNIPERQYRLETSDQTEEDEIPF